MKVVAIITRTKDRPILLERALNSIAQQTYKDFVWVIVNDGGEPNKVDEIAKRAEEKGIDVKVIHNAHSLGMEAASNKGIRETQSKYIVIHDDDDSWEKEFLEATVNFLEADNNQYYKGVVTRCYRVDEKIINNEYCEIIDKYPFNNELELIYFADMVKHNLYPPISFLYRRDMYEEIGGYNEELPVLGDWDFNLRFMLQGDIGVIKELLANYHHRVQSHAKAYGNSVIEGIDKHKQYDNLIRNKLLREDIDNDKVGLGYLVNLSMLIETPNKNNLIKRIKKLIKRQGIKGILARLKNV